MGNHYYDTDGNERHDATIREVRKEGLLLSVTTYIGALAKQGLEFWKINERIKIAYELMMAGNQYLSENDFAKAVEDIFKQRNDAADIGTMTHDMIDSILKEGIPMSAAADFFYAQCEERIKYMWPSVRKALTWYNSVLVTPGKREEILVNKEDRYAGRMDDCSVLKDPNGKEAICILDWKTQKVKNPGLKKDGTSKAGKVSVYKEWPIQLGCYAKPMKARHGYIGVIGTDPTFPFFKAYHYTQEDLLKGYRAFRYLQEVVHYMRDL